MNPEIIGTIAGIITTSSFLPQAIKAIKAPDTKSISLLMYSALSVGSALWCIYGIMLGSFALILANGITLPLALTILFKKISNIKNKID